MRKGRNDEHGPSQPGPCSIVSHPPKMAAGWGGLGRDGAWASPQFNCCKFDFSANRGRAVLYRSRQWASTLSGHPQAFKSASRPGRALTVREVGALSDFDNITVRIADVAARLAVLGDRLGDEPPSSTFPHFIARLNVRNAEIHKAVDVIRVGDAERYRRLIRGRPAPNVQNHPDIRKLKVSGRVAVTQAQNASAKDRFIEAGRSLDVGDGEKIRDADPLPWGHLIALLFDLHGIH